jgi:hypothetical protein
MFVRNGPSQAGQQASGLVSMSMPYQATLSQKYVMLWQHAAAIRRSAGLDVSSQHSSGLSDRYVV